MHTPATARVVSVNVARVRPNPYKSADVTGMEKLPVTGPVHVRPPGPVGDGRGSGLVGDSIGDRAHHGGDDQAVYAYAREDLDTFEPVLGRRLPDGAFGENLTTVGLDVNGALLGERWRLGTGLELQVTSPRTPCATFRGWIGARGWLRTFVAAALPGAYLSVVTSGDVGAGDGVEVVHKPDHDVSIALVFRALMHDHALLPSLLAAGADLHPETRRFVEQWMEHHA